MAATLYICYFGIREPLVRTQVLPYLRLLAKEKIDVHLLTFEPSLNDWSIDDLEKQRAELEADGISWSHLKYHKRPTMPATLYDIFAGARFSARAIKRDQIDVVHARAHMPMAMALLARRFAK